MTKKSFLQFNYKDFTILSILKWFFCVIFFAPIFTFATPKKSDTKTLDSLQISHPTRFYISGEVTISGLENIHQKEVIVLKNKNEQIAKTSHQSTLSQELAKAEIVKKADKKNIEKATLKNLKKQKIINFVLPAGGNTDINKITSTTFLAIVSPKSSLKFSPILVYNYQKNSVAFTPQLKHKKYSSAFSYLNPYKYGHFSLRAPPNFIC